MIGDMAERQDRPAYVRFETRTKLNKKKTEENESGTLVYDNVDFALITPPYSKDCVEIKVDQWFANQAVSVSSGRTPREWLDHWKRQYEAWKRNEEIPLDGTPIKEWSAITPAEVKMILAAEIRTVEDLAAANDEGMRRLGMGAQKLKQRATTWLKSAKDLGPITRENERLTQENASLKRAVERNEEKLNALAEQVALLRKGNTVEIEIPEIDTGEISADDLLEDEPVKKATIKKATKKRKAK